MQRHYCVHGYDCWCDDMDFAPQPRGGFLVRLRNTPWPHNLVKYDPRDLPQVVME